MFPVCEPRSSFRSSQKAEPDLARQVMRQAKISTGLELDIAQKNGRLAVVRFEETLK